MDIYQIVISHNSGWTRKEITIFSIVLMVFFAILNKKVERHKISKSQAISIFLLTGFLGIVFASMVFNRETSVRSYELMPFWSWRQIIFKTDKELLIEVLLNCVLLFPMGVLLPFIFEKKLRWRKIFICGFLVSAVIETCQLVFKCGLFEWDDMIHNGVGCMFGGMIGNVFFTLKITKVQNE